MIALAKSISHTEASLGYGWKQEKEAIPLLRRHITGENPKEIASEFRFVQKLNTNCTKNTISFVISPTISDGQKLTDKGLKLITHTFLDRMNLLNHQAVAFCHKDKKHKHIHLYVNRISFNGEAYNDSFIGFKSQKKSKEIAMDLGLQTVEEVRRIKEKNSKEQRKYILKIHQTILNKGDVKDYKLYAQRLLERDIELVPKKDKSGILKGFRYKYENIDLKASEVHRSMSFVNLKKALDNNKKRIKTNEQTRTNYRSISR